MFGNKINFFRISAFIIGLFMMGTLIQCSKDDVDNPISVDAATAIKRTWKPTKYLVNGSLTTIEDCWNKQFIFKDNNVVNVKEASSKCVASDPGEVFGTYELDGNSLLITTNEEVVKKRTRTDRYVFSIAEINSQKLRLKFSIALKSGIGSTLYEIEFAPA